MNSAVSLLLILDTNWLWTTLILYLEFIFSPDGGVDIEEVAEKTPDRIKKYPIDIKAGLSDATADEVAEFLGFEGDLKSQCSEQVKRLYKMFLEVKEYFQNLLEFTLLPQILSLE